MLSLSADTLGLKVLPEDRHTSVAFDFVQAALDAVTAGQVTISGQSGPTVAARFYAITGTVLYEAWQLFDPARSSLEGKGAGRRLEGRVKRLMAGLSAKRREAFMENVMAAATFQVLTAQAPQAQHVFAEALAANVVPLGLRLDGQAGLVSRQLAQQILAFFATDGAAAGATAPYTPVNNDSANVIDIERWTPEYRMRADPDSGLQRCLTPGWGQVRAYLDSPQLAGFIATLKRPEPFLLEQGATVDLQAGSINMASGEVVPIDRDAVGSLINPAFIDQAERVIKASAELTEEQKFIAEFWEDGVGTTFPPGTWMSFGQYAAEKEDLPLGEEVKLYFTLGNALQSAAVASWKLKMDTDYTRPVRAIRTLSDLGLVGQQDPLTGLFTFEAYSRDTFRTERINGVDWEPYQRPGGSYSPPFPEFTSGHSTFSAAAGTVLEKFVGENFGGKVTGRGGFEPARQKEEVMLSWETWQEAYEQAGLSRIYGGIHFNDGNEQGLALGAQIGEATFQAASPLWAGRA